MTTATNQITTGLRAFSNAFGIIRRNKMGKFFVVPVIINIILAALLIWGGWGLGDWISSLWDSEHGGWLGFLGAAVQWVMPIVMFFLFIFIGGTIVNLLMSPIYTVISEKTDTSLTGREFSSDAKQTVKDIWRAVIIALKSTVKQLVLTLLCLLLNLIPLVGQVASLILIFVINAYYFGYSFMDYTNERYRRSVKDSNNEVWRYKYLAITLGAIYALPMYMFCGTFFAAYVGGICTVAATQAQIELEGKDPDFGGIIEKTK
ncbi:MAG: EI24 domain-containing protein [Bacteroidales bacterium]|nr:EI24 domain-containing protein [Bacteroidales bacterium]